MPAEARRAPHLVWALSLAAFILVADQAVKAWVLEGLALSPPGCLERIPGACRKIELSSVFDLTMVWNRGISFGALEATGWGRWALFALSGVIAIAFTVWMTRAQRWPTALALGLAVGGAIGNMIDRARFGAVADFFDFSGPWFGWMIGNWPVGFPYVFNVADAGITVGAILLLLDQVFLEGAAKPKDHDGARRSP